MSHAFTELIPRTCNICTILGVLDLNSSLLQGLLSLSICNLSSLAIFYFPDNKFNGGIPECLLMLKGFGGRLTYMTNLFSNQLSIVVLVIQKLIHE